MRCGAYGLDVMANGNIVGICRGINTLRIYDNTGAVIGGFTSTTNVNASADDVKAAASGLLYIAEGGSNIFELNQSGTKLRGFGTGGNNYNGVATVTFAGFFLKPRDLFDGTPLYTPTRRSFGW